MALNAAAVARRRHNQSAAAAPPNCPQELEPEQRLTDSEEEEEEEEERPRKRARRQRRRTADSEEDEEEQGGPAAAARGGSRGAKRAARQPRKQQRRQAAGLPAPAAPLSRADFLGALHACPTLMGGCWMSGRGGRLAILGSWVPALLPNCLRWPAPNHPAPAPAAAQLGVLTALLPSCRPNPHPPAADMILQADGLRTPTLLARGAANLAVALCASSEQMDGAWRTLAARAAGTEGFAGTSAEGGWVQ